MRLRTLLNSLRWIMLALGGGLVLAGLAASPLWLRLLLGITGVVLLALGARLVWWYVRPNASRITAGLALETWDVVADDLHHSNTDLIHWDGRFYLVHATSPFHLASDTCHLRLLTSPDARRWELLKTFSLPGEDIRDPKLAAIGGRLILYALANRSWDPEPYATRICHSPDGGQTWSGFRPFEHEGWLLWKPKTQDGRTWFAGGYWHEHGRSALFASEDGLAWRRVASIYQGGKRNDETDIAFLPEGKMITTARVEGGFAAWSYNMIFGDPKAATLIATSAPPYDAFDVRTFSSLTRLDGPALFSHGGRVFAVGRFQPERGRWFTRQGSLFASKRTALFEVAPHGLTWLSDVPSAGDTAYAGVARHAGDLYFSYYTSPIDRDVPWIVGMLNRTSIRMAKVGLDSLVRVADEATSRVGP